MPKARSSDIIQRQIFARLRQPTGSAPVVGAAGLLAYRARNAPASAAPRNRPQSIQAGEDRVADQIGHKRRAARACRGPGATKFVDPGWPQRSERYEAGANKRELQLRGMKLFHSRGVDEFFEILRGPAKPRNETAHTSHVVSYLAKKKARRMNVTPEAEQPP